MANTTRRSSAEKSEEYGVSNAEKCEHHLHDPRQKIGTSSSYSIFAFPLLWHDLLPAGFHLVDSCLEMLLPLGNQVVACSDLLLEFPGQLTSIPSHLRQGLE